MRIEQYDPVHLPAIVELSLRAWAPVFDSLRVALGDGVFSHFYGEDWRAVQGPAVEGVCSDGDVQTWVALASAAEGPAGSRVDMPDGPVADVPDDSDEATRVAGFVSVKAHADDRMGEIYMIAVDPSFQRQGIAATLTNHAETWARESGLAVMMVETGGDPGHAPARETYEASGFGLFPVARYFKTL